MVTFLASACASTKMFFLPQCLLNQKVFKKYFYNFNFFDEIVLVPNFLIFKIFHWLNNNQQKNGFKWQYSVKQNVNKFAIQSWAIKIASKRLQYLHFQSKEIKSTFYDFIYIGISEFVYISTTFLWISDLNQIYSISNVHIGCFHILFTFFLIKQQQKQQKLYHCLCSALLTLVSCICCWLQLVLLFLWSNWFWFILWHPPRNIRL